jgi:glycerol uptake facilitator-like aquaporin
MTWQINKKYLAEFIGAAILLCTVIGSGIMAERLAMGNAAIALLANTLATICILFVLIEILGPVSGAHFNPVVSLVMWWRKSLTTTDVSWFIVVQLLGAVVGAWLAHAMFEMPILQLATKHRTGTGQWLAEVVATAGLIAVVLRAPAHKASALVASYIGAAYWFTASTSFANPAAVVGRMLSDTFAGIHPSDAAWFVLAQCAGACVGYAVSHMLDATRYTTQAQP